MKLSLTWLQRHLQTTASVTEIAAALTDLGFEVEDLHNPAAALGAFLTAEIIEAKQHPNADRLKLCRVSNGRETLQVVCGAPNARTGLKAVLALPGTVIPSTGDALKIGKIRGEESQAMLCSYAELKLSDDSVGIIELPAEAPVGVQYATYAGLDNPVLTLNITPNRPDALGVRGLARELAAKGLGTLLPLPEPPPLPNKAGIAVDLQTSACPHFVAVTLAIPQHNPSPEWLAKLLGSVGQKTISALVDSTNYFSLDQARPLHVFDADKLRGGLTVRLSRAGETFAALDGKTYTLPADVIVITDDSGIISLAGIMGGASTAVDANTRRVVIESAWFDPVTIASAGRALGIVSEARHRFERGVDTASTLPAAAAAAALLHDIAGATISGQTAVGTPLPPPASLTYDYTFTSRIGGVALPTTTQQNLLRALGFMVTDNSVTPPSWRRDIAIQEDLAEEILRLHGFSALPDAVLPKRDSVTSARLPAAERRAMLIANLLAARGLQQTINFVFTSEALAKAFATDAQKLLYLENPISPEYAVMQPSALPNMVLTAKRNLDRSQPDTAFFEITGAYHNTTVTGQQPVAAIVRTGSSPRHWQQSSAPVDYFTIKADIEAICRALAAPKNLQLDRSTPNYYHPHRSACLKLGQQVIAYFGELHPRLCAELGLSGAVMAGEFFYATLPYSQRKYPPLTLSPYQPVLRDFAFIAPTTLAAKQLTEVVQEAVDTFAHSTRYTGSVSVHVQVFDIYSGDKLPAGQKSIALGLRFEPQDRTLTDADLTTLAEKVITAAATVGATLRA